MHVCVCVCVCEPEADPRLHVFALLPLPAAVQCTAVLQAHVSHALGGHRTRDRARPDMGRAGGGPVQAAGTTGWPWPGTGGSPGGPQGSSKGPLQLGLVLDGNWRYVLQGALD